MAGLNFPEYAAYNTLVTKKDNITPFELIPWVLGQCATVTEAKSLLSKTNLLKEDFKTNLPLSPLHWLIADRKTSIAAEPLTDGLKIYDNPIGILTNSPPFDLQLFHLNNFMHLTNLLPQNHFSKDLDLKIYSNGMGALGMPGDWSSQSRFVKAAFTKMNSICADSEDESVSQFFHILNSVEHPRGCVVMDDNLYEITIYSSCCNTDKGIYYYKTYDNSQITAMDMRRENLDDTQLISYPLKTSGDIFFQN